MRTKLMLGDNIESLKKVPDNYIDSAVTDPPYGLKFMGKKWDYEVPSIEFWKEVYRVLKPGGHILSFGGTRTYHRMVVNIEDAGFEIRDQIMWIYGSGFPKSLNIGKAVDKIQGNEREVIKIENVLDIRSGNLSGIDNQRIDHITTKGTSPYEGWGTALKPANEPICLARKPISEDTIAENVLKWGTGGINVDGCRIGTDIISSHNAPKGTFAGGEEDRGSDINSYSLHEGRFPANIIFDEDASKLLGEPSRFFYCAKVSKSERNKGLDGFEEKVISQGNEYGIDKFNTKAKSNFHPTVKPIKLMSYLCRLITPKNGIVLDPFMGSGSTGIAAKMEEFDFIGMEMDEEYFKIAETRIKNWKY